MDFVDNSEYPFKTRNLDPERIYPKSTIVGENTLHIQEIKFEDLNLTYMEGDIFEGLVGFQDGEELIELLEEEYNRTFSDIDHDYFELGSVWACFYHEE